MTEQGKARILVIDDDDAFRRMIGQMLERAGFVVMPAHDFSAAIKFIDSDAPIDLLLTDVGMPAGTPHGVSIALMARTKRPRLKVVYMSGTHSAAQIDAVADAAAFLAKPFRQDDLLRIVESVLATPFGAEPFRFASLDEAIVGLYGEPEPMVLTRFAPEPADSVVVAENKAAGTAANVPAVGDRADRRRDHDRTADIELEYLYERLLEHGHVRQVVANDDGTLKELTVTRVEIDGDDGVYGFVKPRPLQG
jgi:CheY-like chemotaxis protein